MNQIFAVGHASYKLCYKFHWNIVLEFAYWSMGWGGTAIRVSYFFSTD